MNAYGKNAETYLSQRILAASPEQRAGIVMEAGQLHLGRAIQALTQNNISAAASSFIRVSEVIMEATVQLNLETGGECAQSLERLYGWWNKEIMEASVSKDTVRLAAVLKGMGEIRESWEQLHEQKVGKAGASLFKVGDLLV